MADAADSPGLLAPEAASAGSAKSRGPVDVSVAVFQRPDGSVLLAKRPASKVYAGFWEFPGGKVERGESLKQALVREVREELGVEVEIAYPWITQVFTYPHATVRLHFFRVPVWRGEPEAIEHEGLTWQHPAAVSVAPLLPANGPVLRGLQIPAEYAISQASALGTEAFLERLDARLSAGLKLIQVREPGWTREALAELVGQVIRRARPCGALVLVNNDVAVAHQSGADGVHLTSMQLRSRKERPDLAWVGASCHNAEELALAAELGADFAVLGPVNSTPGHPDSPPIGWAGFRSLTQGLSLPVYALGGMVREDVGQAWEHGAQGIAMMRGAWARG